MARQLEAADAVVVLWSEDSVQSHWVLDEATIGRDRGCLIPVRFDDTMPPLGFRQLQVLDLVDGDAEDAKAIGRAADQILGRPSKGGTGKRAARRDRKPWWTPFAWAIFALVFIVVMNFMK